jgi:hypothetical protein
MDELRAAKPNQLGRLGESVWAQILAASGVHYIPLAQIDNGGAPMAIGDKSSVVLPDFDCASTDGNWRAFVEIKCKEQPVLFRMRNQLRHGIDKSKWNAYRSASDLWQKECAVALLELFGVEKREWSGRLLVERLNNLGTPFDGFSNQEHMVYWPRKAFCDLDTLTFQEVMEIDSRSLKPPSYRAELLQIFRPFEQRELF